jgi:XRE family transcriptional regulator, aerobic/anaerobic benzoate catabolism transcriptional regulator
MYYKAFLQASMGELGPTSFKGSQEIAQRIRSARARAGLTRKQLAAAASASERYLATLEAGNGNPSVEMLVAIAEALNIAMAELLPMGGEQDLAVSQAASQLRRLPLERVHEVLTWVGKSGQGRGDKARRISLVGLRGAGKTSLGKALADRLNVPFFEISKEIEQRYGGSISILMEINGPAALRRYEAEVLNDVLGRNVAAVIAAPGAIVSAGLLYDQLLESSWTIWLEASPEDHMSRVVAQGDLRPIAGNKTAMNDLRSILAAREADYARADVRINTSAQSFEATLDALERSVASLI